MRAAMYEKSYVHFFLRIFRFLLENNHTLDTFSFYTKSQIVD